ncbi:hypothetical protein [Shrimp hemocyte iridescent virus]|uniref:Uncharacterized protein n=2 Tax=Decapodiridovirus litopenaeus1 TaxID=3428192 RepID=A0A291B0Z1_9VIRU|nr:hypothetical protein KM509_gp156 [Shrimp hemocyte iridescent virus]ATE87165.1 hypothetical protein [Shrimp hemocyte iridescent virus]
MVKKGKVKNYMTLTAEQDGSSQIGAMFSFGNGSDGDAYKKIGHMMLLSGEIVRMGLCAAKRDASPAGILKVRLVINGEEKPEYEIEKGDGKYGETVTFAKPLKVNMGDMVNFMCLTAISDLDCSLVSVLIARD